ncbi:hypothetical protein JT231_00950 [Helicobacter pylori]|nr:hypothetical protein [Helicobacter pylori]
MTQSVVASGHIAQAGLSDAIVVSLSTLAGGIVWEHLTNTKNIDKYN